MTPCPCAPPADAGRKATPRKRPRAQAFHVEDQQANALHDRAPDYRDCVDCRSINPFTSGRKDAK